MLRGSQREPAWSVDPVASRSHTPRENPLFIDRKAEKVLQLYREKYFDFNVRHFHEKLGEEHGVQISYTWVKMALQGAGLVNKQRRRGTHRRRRPRRPLPGMLLHFATFHGRIIINAAISADDPTSDGTSELQKCRNDSAKSNG